MYVYLKISLKDYLNVAKYKRAWKMIVHKDKTFVFKIVGALREK